jgi:PhoH-like ATPase
MAKKNYIIDTSVFLTDADALFAFENNDVFIPLKVLEEIDKHKKRQDSVGFHARKIIKHLDGLRAKGSLVKGVRPEKGAGIIKVCDPKWQPTMLPPSLDLTVPDHIILASALRVQVEWEKRKTIVVSRDINMRVVANSLGLEAEDYETLQAVEDADKLYDGFAEVLVDDQLIDLFYADEEIVLEEEQAVNLHPNQFLMLKSSANPKKTALARFKGVRLPLSKVAQNIGNISWGIKPRNKEQSFAFDLLFDDDVPLVTLIGKAGSGKTLMAIAAGMEQCLGMSEKKYSRIIISRPVQPLGKDIGFLPGTMEEKMLPWLKPIQDNLQMVVGHDKTMLQSFMEKGKLEVEALTYIRGRSISNAFVIIDEAQNLTAHEVKTIITRIGDNTKIVLTGDVEQIDNIYTNETSNGLAFAVEKFKTYELSGHITFKRGERSKLATLAAKIL